MTSAQREAYDASIRHSAASTECFLAALEILHPKTMVDLGCGNGHLVYLAASFGMRALGLDICLPFPERTVGEARVFRADLTYRWFLEPADLVLCWEVAEHLPPDDAQTICDTIIQTTKPMGFVLFTAAVPGQGGMGHLNEQPQSYWRQKLTQSGVLWWDEAISSSLSKRWLEVAPTAPWYGNNLQVFQRGF